MSAPRRSRRSSAHVRRRARTRRPIPADHPRHDNGRNAMPINILMPALSPTMEKGNLAKWLKKEGDKVKSGDVIAEIETDKATMEVEAVDEGTLAKILVPEGTADVPVNQLIAVLAGEGEDVKAAARAAGCRALRRSSGRPAPHQPDAAPAAPKPAPAAASSRRSQRRVSARAWQRRRPRLRVAAGAAAGARCRHRPIARRGRRAAWPRRRARRRAGKIGRSVRTLPARRCRAGGPAAEPADGGRPDRDAVRAGHLRGRAARQHPQDHRAAAGRSEADHPAFLSDRRLRHRRADGGARGHQRRRAEGRDGKPAWKLSVNDFVIKALALALQKCRTPT